jgi:exosortase H (IPTLxxWG-CTERM-specific)
MVRFFILFLVLLAGLFGVELTPWAQQYFVEPWTSQLASISAALVTLADPNVMVAGKVLRSTQNGFAVSIEAGCNGVEATIVLLAAVLAFPAPWKNKVVGLLAGIFAVQGLNVVRVISLFYLGQWDYRMFEWAHLYVWQALIMLDVLIVWLIWVRTLPRTTDSRGGGDGPPGGARRPSRPAAGGSAAAAAA